MVDLVKQFRSVPVMRVLLPGVAVVGIAALLVWYITDDPLRGVVYVTVTDGLSHAATITLPELSTTTLQVADAALLAQIPSPDGDSTASLTVSLEEGRGIVVSTSGASRTVVLHGTIPTPPAWAHDSSTFAFAVLPAESEGDTGNPATWQVVRAVANGDSLVLGHGFRPMPAFDDRVYALTERGIELLDFGKVGEIVVASAAPVHTATPFAASPDGTQVAWVNPADRSLQVFEHTNGFFVPLLFLPGVSPHSIVFSPDGMYLLVAFQTETETRLSRIRIDGGSTDAVGVLQGGVALHAWHYE
ncbi:MAG: hypothetical protein AAB955_00955 [Patescibacteria group bacterium]